jgi:hypothetical protein
MSHAALRIIEDIDQTPRTVIETTKDEFFSKRLNYDAITTRRDRVTALGRRSEPSETGLRTTISRLIPISSGNM